MAQLTLSQIRETVRSLVPSPQNTDADLNVIIKHAHRVMAKQYQWSQRRRETVIQTTAPYSAGTVTVTTGSGAVTGVGTAWTSAMIGRQIRIPGEYPFFYVGTVPSPTSLTLADAQLGAVVWAGVSAVGQGYAIFQDQYAVPADVGVIMTEVMYWPLRETSLTEIDRLDPRRTSTGASLPDRWYWCRTAVAGGAQVRYVGLWPVPGLAATMRMPYLIEPPDLTADGDLPVCPAEVLELAAQMRAALRCYAITGDPRWAASAKAYQFALYGSPETPSSAGVQGILQQALHDDETRFGLPTRLGGTPAGLGIDELALHDYEWPSF